MPYRDALSDPTRMSPTGNMNYGTVLNITPGADLNPVDIPSKRRAEPDARVFAERHVPDNRGRWCNVV